MHVSIVIPVYNEEDQIASCLEAIARQSHKPFEVIVVDNNSTDNTVAVARRFPFVTVLREPRQGVAYARDRGFNAAHGDIIGRLDADSVIAPDWVKQVKTIFADPDIAIATGSLTYRNVALSPIVSKIDLIIRRHLARVLGREVAIQGCNMALRRSVWQAVRGELCYTRGLHEDFDIAIHANWLDYHVIFDERLRAGMYFRQVHSSFRKFVPYVLQSAGSYKMHGLRSRFHMYPVIGLVLLTYPIIKLLSKGYDPETGKLSWARFFAEAYTRVNPATFLD